MHLWRRLAAPRWLIANEAALRLRAGDRLAIIERPNRQRLQLEVVCKREQGRELIAEFGGRLEQLPRDWLRRFSRGQKSQPLRIGKRLVITRSGGFQTAGAIWKSPFLVIPAGAAFGTGEHTTTAMSLRLLEQVTQEWKPGWSSIDLGTGSGILALAAKCLGAGRVVAIDIDPSAVSTAKENARRNKIGNVVFKTGEALRWKDQHERFNIITANLFSELIIKGLPIWRTRLKRRGWLILSGILRRQEMRLIRVLRLNKIDIVHVRRRGKWIAVLAKS